MPNLGGELTLMSTVTVSCGVSSSASTASVITVVNHVRRKSRHELDLSKQAYSSSSYIFVVETPTCSAHRSMVKDEAHRVECRDRILCFSFGHVRRIVVPESIGPQWKLIARLRSNATAGEDT